MDCEVAREALSARMDGEREPVPAARVDEHLAGCRLCAEWYRVARQQSRMLDALAGASAGVTSAGTTDEMRSDRGHPGLRYLLGIVGVAQLCLALVQVFGVDFGLTSPHHGMAGGAHLLNESTAWSAALGVTLIAAALRPVFAPGIACVAGAYAVALAYYVAVDAMGGDVTAARVATHLPVLVGAVLAGLLWRGSRPRRRDRTVAARPAAGDDTAEVDALDERRRRRLGAPDNSAA